MLRDEKSGFLFQPFNLRSEQSSHPKKVESAMDGRAVFCGTKTRIPLQAAVLSRLLGLRPVCELLIWEFRRSQIDEQAEA